jgi:hypothetical protein
MILAFKSDENADSCIKINENPAQINANADSCINIIDFSSHRSQLPASEIDEKSMQIMAKIDLKAAYNHLKVHNYV